MITLLIYMDLTVRYPRKSVKLNHSLILMGQKMKLIILKVSEVFNQGHEIDPLSYYY